MKTPIADFVRRYAAGGGARFHMPGHKGRPYLASICTETGRVFSPEALDITEIDGADVLYDAAGIVDESEANATALFGTAHTFYSTEGSTLAIKAMLTLVATALPRGTRPHFLAGRNAHKAFLNGAALLDAEVTWMHADEAAHLCACPLSADDVENAVKRCEKKPHAVYLTSPDYLGNVADIAAIAAVCDAAGLPLLVDNAHGAYLAFLSENRHPIALGATMCADSAHKTLPVLTGGAYLHVAKKASARYLENARHALALHASTSPSYLILQSLDLCNAILADDYAARLAAAEAHVTVTCRVLGAHGYRVAAREPLKLVIDAQKSGYTGEELAKILSQSGVAPEFADRDFLVLMCTPDNSETDFLRLEQALLALPPRAPQESLTPPPVFHPVRVLSVREAMLAPAETVPLSRALGRICASPTVSCPPAVPVVVAGERIDEAALALLAYYGADTVRVVEE
ncbi:MAG: PLP-dependent transferase [Clostridia bacterium]|nr:PLP-dependent transferase [Clostridia bacterium]